MTDTVCVVGSLMMDLITYATRRPLPGETLVGDDFTMTPGGKGFNQAVAAARAGSRTSLVGRVGADQFGSIFRQALAEEEIDTTHLHGAEQDGTGVGLPVVERGGQNSIIIVPRANASVTAADVAAARSAITAADVLLLQLELPLDAVWQAARIARSAGVKVILNPAPAAALPADLLSLVDYFVPNEVEVCLYAEGEVMAERLDDLASRFPRMNVVVTWGERGVIGRLVGDDGVALSLREPAPVVNAVDTVGAGDVFCGYLAAGLAHGVPPAAAIRSAVSAASLAVTRTGSGLSAPYAKEIQA
ncbi:sugar kinase, ribokinase [Frankia torreyi]|uniref:Deoxyribokinase n=2 Tax=Frankia TaxID=1854 RepID=A0A0D8B5E7_9ACTN|nr:ribokinase [Frankia torreyi]KJE19518.1 sugar kinase, ribokinase [Frankia torreyi]